MKHRARCICAIMLFPVSYLPASINIDPFLPLHDLCQELLDSSFTVPFFNSLLIKDIARPKMLVALHFFWLSANFRLL
jgi:hypothetical protein